MLDKLTEKQMVIFNLAFNEKLSNNQIADKLQIRRSVVVDHKRDICRKLQIERVAEYKC